MRINFFFLIACAAFIAHIKTEVVLYPPKNDNMIAQDYLDRATYMAAIVKRAEEGGATCSFTNDTNAGPFKIHLKFPEPLPTQNIYSLSLSAIMQTQQVEIPGGERRRLPSAVENKWFDINLIDGSTTSGKDYYFEISIDFLEIKWITTDMDTEVRFSSVFKFFFNTTETTPYILNVLVQCPAALKRQKTVTGSYSSTQVTSLTSDSAGQVDIDLSISATLVPCVDEFQTDASLCTRKIASDPNPEYKLNDYGKFELYLDNSDFAAVYYLIRHKIEVKTNAMSSAVDFTSSTTAGPVTAGKMTFILPMVIVGDPLTVSAIATLSTTATSRRMLASAHAKATYAASDVGVTTDSGRSYTSGLSSYIISIVLFLGMMLILI